MSLDDIKRHEFHLEAIIKQTELSGKNGEEPGDCKV